MSARRAALWALAVLCAAMSGVCRATPGMRFSALLLLCGAAFLAVMAALDRLAESKRWARLCRNALWGLFGAGLALFFALEGVILSGARGDAEDAPASCLIVLGAGVNGTQPSLILWSRLEAALRYLEAHPDVPVIVSGCQGQGEAISEAECMYRWLVAHGADGARVWKEERASSTRTSFAYSYALMRERGLDPTAEFAFVTSDFHVFRSRLLADAPHGRAVSASLPKGAYYTALEVNFFVREAFALANEFMLKVDLDI